MREVLGLRLAIFNYQPNLEVLGKRILIRNSLGQVGLWAGLCVWWWGVLIVNQGGKTQPTMSSGFPRLCLELCKNNGSTGVQPMSFLGCVWSVCFISATEKKTSSGAL